MQYRPLGKSGIEASVVAFGTWAAGGWMWGGSDSKEAVKAIQTALDNGVNAIDTAPVYGFGAAEEIVGRAIRGRRDKVVLMTKCGLIWHAELGTHYFTTDDKSINELGSRRVYKHLGPESVRHEVESSLARLGVNIIDLYQTHWQDQTTLIEDTMAELMKLKDEGKIRAVGVCNATPRQMDEYAAAGELVSSQERYSMLDREAERLQMDYCRKHQMAFLAYSPLALGLLSGKITPDRKFGEGDMRASNTRFSTESLAKVAEMLGEFEPIADGHNITMAQLAIAWAFHQPGCTHVLVGARNPRQAQENARAGTITLSQDELRHMRSVIDRFSQEIPPGRLNHQQQ